MLDAKNGRKAARRHLLLIRTFASSSCSFYLAFTLSGFSTFEMVYSFFDLS
jgi:hypothetical protein